MKVFEQKISGMLFSTKEKTFKTLISTIPMNVQSELKWVVDAATNSTNVDKVKAIQAELETRVIKDDVFAPVSLTFAVEGKPILDGTSRTLPTLCYASS
ncbi:hypothetical protein [Vibrio anguillarum]|uniref:hypothetical protein n=1 Tax=Vibrio anguillarum TaxID=55601 RepID=UPI003CF7FF63